MQAFSIFKGKIFSDYRGTMLLNNDFDMTQVKRMYIIRLQPNIIRAWQGHQLEHKWFIALSGKIKLQFAYRPLDVSLENLNMNTLILDSEEPMVVHLPGAFINGFEGIDEHAVLQVFSNMSVQESELDGYRISQDELGW